MINVNQITSQLADMPDQALQQYAQMHKDDPYTLSLAVAESNRRKQMRTAAQGQGRPQPPKVNEQEVQNMAPQQLPEESGIAQLPAQNLARMAGGGIVAFADAGLVQETSSPVGRMLGGAWDTFKQFNQRMDDRLIDKRELEFRRLRAKQGMFEQLTQEQQAARNAELADITQKQQDARNAGPTDMKAYGPTQQDQRALYVVPASSKSKTPVVPEGSVDPTAKLREKTAPTARPAVPAVPAVPARDYMALQDKMLQERSGLVDPTANAREEVNKAKKAAASLEAESFEKYVASRPQAYVGAEKRATAREAALTKDTQRNEAMSFVNAGLAMMQSTGKGLAGIAEGAAVGTKQYMQGLEKIKLAKEKMDETHDKIEEYRRSEEMLTEKERRGLRSLISQLPVAAAQNMLDGVVLATGRTDSQVKTALELQQRADAAAAAAAATVAAAKINASARSKNEANEPRYLQEYQKGLADPVQGATFKALYPTFQAFLAAYDLGGAGGDGGGMVSAPPAGAAVR